jgi:hypothetical protein
MRYDLSDKRSVTQINQTKALVESAGVSGAFGERVAAPRSNFSAEGVDYSEEQPIIGCLLSFREALMKQLGYRFIRERAEVTELGPPPIHGVKYGTDVDRPPVASSGNDGWSTPKPQSTFCPNFCPSQMSVDDLSA